MAYLEPASLTCPLCGLSARIELVVGTGPASRRGDVPYRSLKDPGPFTRGKTETGGTALFCPEDGHQLWESSPGQPALGPLTEREMQRWPYARDWLAPGTENPFPPKPVPHNPADPFARGIKRRPGRPKPR